MCTIITKSLRTFFNQTVPEYYKYTINNNKVVETELTPSEALTCIRENNYPELFRLDHNNVIWGDSNFKEKCPNSFKRQLEFLI